MSLLIAEIGNSHMGSMRLAKELIRVAVASGADLIKGQAFVAKDLRGGSMPIEFYQHCAFTEDQYLELMAYAQSLKSEMFYSIFSPGFDRLKLAQRWRKSAASQTIANQDRAAPDSDWSVVSVPKSMIDANAVPKFKRAWMLYATEYMVKDAALEYLDKLQYMVGRPCGLSDHSIGAGQCLRAIRWYGANCIEKHFTIQKNLTFGGVTFRDTVHGATPRELAVIASALQNN